MSSSGGRELRRAAALALLLLAPAGCRPAPAGFERPRPAALPARPRFVPEPQRRLAHVVMALHSSDRTLRYQRPVLERLPAATRVDLLVPRELLAEVERELREHPVPPHVTLLAYGRAAPRGADFFLLLPDRDRLVRVRPRDPALAAVHGTRWAQDLFEVVLDEHGAPVLLVPWVQRQLRGRYGEPLGRLVPDTVFLDRLRWPGVRIAVLRAAFNGGNVVVDEIGGRRLAFVGVDALRKTRTLARAYGETPPDRRRFARMFARALGADEVLIVGGQRPQPALLYHLDQAMLPLGGGRMAVARLDPAAGTLPALREVASFLTDLHGLLRRAGYAIVDVPVRPEDLARYRHPLNGVPYVDPGTGERVLMLPRFGERPPAGAAVFARLGFRVVEIPTSASDLKGGVHCLLNVLE